MKRTDETITEDMPEVEKTPVIEIPVEKVDPVGEASFKKVKPPEEEPELTLGDLLGRYVILASDIGKTAQDVIDSVREHGVEERTQLTKQETALLDALLFDKYATMDFSVSKLKLRFRSISSEMVIAAEQLIIEEVGERKLTKQEALILSSRVQLARYILIYDQKNFTSPEYESLEQLKIRYAFVSTISISLLDYCNRMVQKFVETLDRVLDAETLTNF